MESYLRRWASVAGVVRSFTATNSMSGFPRAVRKTLRPMRPKPLIPTFTAAMIFGCSCRVLRGSLRVLRLERGADWPELTISIPITGVGGVQMMVLERLAACRGRCERFAGRFYAVLQASYARV